MKKLYSLLFLSVASLSFGQQAPPFYEGFNYPEGATLQTQPGWTVLNTGDDLLITAGSLTYPGIPASTGNKLAFDGAGIDTTREFLSQTTSTVYYSFLLRVTSVTAATGANGGYFAGFVSTGTNYGATAWLKKVDDATFNIGINPRTTAANTQFGSTAYSINTTYLIVASYTFNPSTGDDVVKLYVNPTLGSEPATPTAMATNTGGTDLASVSRFLIRQDSVANTPFVEMDELRIANNWTDVINTTNPLNTNTSSIAGLKVYPNPVTNGMLFIETAAGDTKNVAIYDLLGKNVMNVATASSEVNVSSLRAGVYLVKITENGVSSTRKLMIK